MSKRISMVLALVLVVGLLTAFVMPPSNMVYRSFTTVDVRGGDGGTGPVIGVVYAGRNYPVISYNWTPATALNSWALIEYAPNVQGYVPVQLGYSVVGQVVFNVGVFCCGSIPQR